MKNSPWFMFEAKWLLNNDFFDIVKNMWSNLLGIVCLSTYYENSITSKLIKKIAKGTKG